MKEKTFYDKQGNTLRTEEEYSHKELTDKLFVEMTNNFAQCFTVIMVIYLITRIFY